MARIRSIKPEFRESESMGRLSRDARLTFILLWTLADDDGRFRAHPRLLCAELYPYDEDAQGKLGGWLAEIEREGCVRFYRVGKDSYGEITGWSEHQKIDHKSKSRIPTPDSQDATPDTREGLAKPREGLAKPREDVASPRETLAPDLDLDLDLDLDQKHLSTSSTGPPPVAPAVALVAAPAPAEPEPDPPDDPASPGVRVFEHWRQATGYLRAKFKGKRRQRVADRLADGYSPEELCLAVDGCLKTPHNTGQNDTGERYDDLELVCRDVQHVDRFIRNARDPPKARAAAARPKDLRYGHVSASDIDWSKQKSGSFDEF